MNRRSGGTSSLSARKSSPLRPLCEFFSRSSKASAMATSLALPNLARSASPAAPVPRPPHPTSASWIVESPAAWTVGTATPASAEAAAIWPTRLPNWRRDMRAFSLMFMTFSFKSQRP
jgi:hypothetical protein